MISIIITIKISLIIVIPVTVAITITIIIIKIITKVRKHIQFIDFISPYLLFIIIPGFYWDNRYEISCFLIHQLRQEKHCCLLSSVFQGCRRSFNNKFRIFVVGGVFLLFVCWLVVVVVLSVFCLRDFFFSVFSICNQYFLLIGLGIS